MNPALRDLILGTSGDPPTPPFSPTDISGLSLWFDASDTATVVLDGSNNVSQWDDKTGSGLNATQPSSTQRPGYSGGLIVFDGIDDSLVSGRNLSSATASSVFAALRYRTSSGSHRVAMGFGTNSSFSGQLLEKNRTAGKIGYTCGRNTPSGNEASFAGSNTTTAVISQGSTYSGTTLTGYLNGSSDGTTSFTGPLNSGSGFVIGRYFNILSCDVNVGEIVVYTKALSAGEITSIHSYFAAKWGIT